MITGRSMDWPYGFNSHFYVVPWGERINGAVVLSGLSPQMVWVNLNQIDFRPGSGIRSIRIEGNVNNQLKPAPPIRFLAPK